MSKSKKTGKHTQAKGKISLNLRQPFRGMLEEIKLKTEEVRGEPITRTQAIEESINGFYVLMKVTEERAMNKHERSEARPAQLEQIN